MSFLILKFKKFLLKNNIKCSSNKKLKNFDKKLCQHKKNKNKYLKPRKNKKQNKKYPLQASNIYKICNKKIWNKIILDKNHKL